MKTKITFSLFVLLVAFLSVAKAGSQTIFYEVFSKMNMEYILNNGSKQIAPADYDATFDNAGWTGTKIYYGYYRTSEAELHTEFNEVPYPRFGTTKVDAYLITPQLDFTGGVYVSFKVKSIIRDNKGEPMVENPNMVVEYAANGVDFTPIHLVDDMDGLFAEKTFDIPAESATATAKLKFNRATPTANNRFFLADVLITKLSTGLTNILDDNLQIQSEQNGIIVKSINPITIQLYDITGSLVKEINANNNEQYFSVAQGIYIVKAKTKSFKIIVK